MKRVDIGFWTLVCFLTYLLYFLYKNAPQVIKNGYLCIYILGCFIFFVCIPKIVKRKILEMRKETPGKNFLLYGDFFLPEIYLLDVENGLLKAWFLTNPFKIQTFDMKEVRSAELLKNIACNGLIASIRCRLHMEDGKHDMWVFRNARQGRKAWIDQEYGQEVIKLGEDLEEYCWLAIQKSRQRIYINKRL